MKRLGRFALSAGSFASSFRSASAGVLARKKEWRGRQDYNIAKVSVMGNDRIEADPRIMLGKPVIRGTRIPVELVLRKLGEGATESELLTLSTADYRRHQSIHSLRRRHSRARRELRPARTLEVLKPVMRFLAHGGCQTSC